MEEFFSIFPFAFTSNSTWRFTLFEFNLKVYSNKSMAKFCYIFSTDNNCPEALYHCRSFECVHFRAATEISANFYIFIMISFGRMFIAFSGCKSQKDCEIDQVCEENKCIPDLLPILVLRETGKQTQRKLLKLNFWFQFW